MLSAGGPRKPANGVWFGHIGLTNSPGRGRPLNPLDGPSFPDSADPFGLGTCRIGGGPRV